MKHLSKLRQLACIVAAASGASIQAQNLIAIQMVQDATGVTISYQGSFNTSGWLLYFQAGGNPGGATFSSASPFPVNGLIFNDGITPVDIYIHASSVLGLPGSSVPSTGFSGQTFGFQGATFPFPAPDTPYVAIGLPNRYISGTTISGQLQFAAATLSDFNASVGDSQTLNLPGNNTITITAVPEPSEWAAIGAGLCGAAAVVRRLRPKAPAKA